MHEQGVGCWYKVGQLVQRCQVHPACVTDAAGCTVIILKDLQVLQRSQPCQLCRLCIAANGIHMQLAECCELCEARKGSSLYHAVLKAQLSELWAAVGEADYVCSGHLRY